MADRLAGRRCPARAAGRAPGPEARERLPGPSKTSGRGVVCVACRVGGNAPRTHADPVARPKCRSAKRTEPVARRRGGRQSRSPPRWRRSRTWRRWKPTTRADRRRSTSRAQSCRPDRSRTTVHAHVAGVGSVLPAGSVARTAKVCGPAESPEWSAGDDAPRPVAAVDDGTRSSSSASLERELERGGRWRSWSARRARGDRRLGWVSGGGSAGVRSRPGRASGG